MENEKNPKKTQVIDSKGRRDYDAFEEIRRKYQTPGTVIRGDELPNNQPRMRPLTEQEMKDLKNKKGYAKGGFVPFAKKGDKKAADAKANPFAKKKFAEGGSVTEEMDELARGDGGRANWETDYEAGDRADRVGDRPAGNQTKARRQQSFREAFAEARKTMGSGKTFTWNGKKYSTTTAADKAKASAMDTAMKKIEAHEGRKRARDAAEAGRDMPGYKRGGRVGYAKGGMVGCGHEGKRKMASGGSVARGMGCALRGGKYST